MCKCVVKFFLFFFWVDGVWTPSHEPSLSFSWMWAIQKEIKDAYPKKVCHMPTRHDIKKRERRCIPEEGMPHAHKACQRKKDSPHPKEIKEREIVHEKEFIHHPPKKKKNIYHHTLAHLDQGLWPVSFGSTLWLSNRSKASMPLYSYPKLHISLIKW